MGDPHPDTGVFGNNDCLGKIRGYEYDAVIGIGGGGKESQRYNIFRKLIWIGIRPNKRKLRG